MGARSRGTGAGAAAPAARVVDRRSSPWRSPARSAPRRRSPFPRLTRADAPAPAPVAIVAPVPALGPLAATRRRRPPRRRAALDPLAGGDVASANSPDRHRPGHRHRPVEPDRRHPARPRQHREAAHHSAALLTLDPTDRLVTRVVAGPTPARSILVGGGDPTLTALPAGKEGVYPDPSRLTALADAVPRPRRPPSSGCWSTPAATAARRSQPSWEPADVAGGFVTPIEPLMLDGGRRDPSAGGRRRVARPALTAGRALAGLLGADAGTSRRAPPRRTPRCSARSARRRSPTSSSTRSVTRTTCSPRCSPGRSRSSARPSPSFDGAAAQTLVALSQADSTPQARSWSTAAACPPGPVPAQLLGAVLAQAAAPAQGARDTQFLRPIVTGLPVAGGDGTLADRFATGTPSSRAAGSCGRRPAR